MAVNAIKKEIASILENMNAAYFGNQTKLQELGHLGDKNTNTNLPTGDGLIKKLFETQYPSSGTPPFQSDTSSSKNVAVVNDNNTVTNLDAGSNQGNFNSFSVADVKDINIYNIANNDSKEILKRLYALHSLTEASKWKTFVDNVQSGSATPFQGLNLKGPEINGSSSVAITDTDIVTVFDENTRKTLIQLAKDPVFPPLALRRLVFLYIRMVSFYVAMDGKFSSNGPLTDKLAQSIYNLLDAEYKKMADATMENIATGINRRIKRYNAFSDGINSINDTYEGTRDFTKKQAERMADEGKYEKKAANLFYVAIAVLAITLLSSTVAVFLGMDFRKRLMVAGGGMAFAAVAGLVMIVVFTNQVVEGFASSSLAFDSSVNADTINYYNNAILELARDYLVTTSNMLSSIRSYQTFGNATYSMAKEYRHFNDANVQLRNTGEKYKASHRASDLYQKAYGASIYLFIILAIVASATAMGYIFASERLPAAEPYALGAGAFLAFVALFVFLLEITGYVRTDGDKKYWGVPKTNL